MSQTGVSQQQKNRMTGFFCGNFLYCLQAGFFLPTDILQILVGFFLFWRESFLKPQESHKPENASWCVFAWFFVRAWTWAWIDRVWAPVSVHRQHFNPNYPHFAWKSTRRRILKFWMVSRIFWITPACAVSGFSFFCMHRPTTKTWQKTKQT